MLVNSDKYCPSCNGDLDKICNFCAYDKSMILDIYDIKTKYGLSAKKMSELKSSIINVHPNDPNESAIRRWYAEDVEKLVLEKYCKPNSKMRSDIIKSLEHRPIRKERYMQIREELIGLVNKTQDPAFNIYNLGNYNVYICDYYSENENNNTIVHKVYEEMRFWENRNDEFAKALELLDDALYEELDAYDDYIHDLENTCIYKNTLWKYNTSELMTEFLKSENSLKELKTAVDKFEKTDQIKEYIENKKIKCACNIEDYCESYYNNEIDWNECKTLIDRQSVENDKNEYITEVVLNTVKSMHNDNHVTKNAKDHYNALVRENLNVQNYLNNPQITNKDPNIEKIIRTIIRKRYLGISKSSLIYQHMRNICEDFTQEWHDMVFDSELVETYRRIGDDVDFDVVEFPKILPENIKTFIDKSYKQYTEGLNQNLN